jgi:bleomycin hydrolase
MKKFQISILFCILLLLFFSFGLTSCVQKEKAVEKQMIQISDKELQEKDVAVYETKSIKGKERTYLSFDFSRIEKPGSLEEFNSLFHFPPLRQGNTGTCWCFSTTSFLESEMKRMGKSEVKLSEIYTVYWEFLEKARRFIREKGNSFFGHGSENNAVTARMKQYGAVRAADYTGLLPGQTEHDHNKLFQELDNYLQFCKKNEYWDEEKAISYVKSILNKYLGKPPETIEVEGRAMTPKEYLDNVLRLPLDDYVEFMSFKYLPFYTKGEYKVPDNWWHSQDYYNVPLPEFYDTIVKALKKGYSVALGGDVSEPGMSGKDDIAVIPTFDLPAKLIDQDSREFRFNNRTSTDDHAIHIVGYKESPGHSWFLIKDSMRSAFEGKFKGYYFYRDDYVKLKMLTFMVHKDAVAELLEKFKK